MYIAMWCFFRIIALDKYWLECFGIFFIKSFGIGQIFNLQGNEISPRILGLSPAGKQESEKSAPLVLHLAEYWLVVLLEMVLQLLRVESQAKRCLPAFELPARLDR